MAVYWRPTIEPVAPVEEAKAEAAVAPEDVTDVAAQRSREKSEEGLYPAPSTYCVYLIYASLQ